MFEKDYNAILTETYDYFQSQGVSIIGEGYKEIASNPALFESYVESLVEGANANDAAIMSTLMTNSNRGILQESSMTGIQPVASLSMPVIRKLWPKFALKEAIKTEVAKSPRFVVSYTKPYMQKGDDEKIYLPRGLRDAEFGDNLSAAGKKTYVDFAETVAVGAVSIADVTSDPAVTLTNTASLAKKQPCDECIITGIYAVGADTDAQNDIYSALAAGQTIDGSTYKVTVDGTAVDVFGLVDGEYVKIDSTNVTNFATQSSSDYITDVVVYKVDVAIAGAYKVYNTRLNVYNSEVAKLSNGGQLIVNFDPVGKATLVYVGGPVASSIYVTGKVGVSTEYNEDSYTVGFDIARQDIDIPTGQHINASLPVEALDDAMALYQIDGTKETVDIMTNIFAQKLDLEVLNFIQNSFVGQPNNTAFADYAGSSEFAASFDCKPAAGYAGSPKSWREELKPLIDFMATKIKNATYLQAGMFTIVANPLDANLISNAEWSFRAGQGSNMDGVNVDYSVGSYMGANAYKIIASVNVPAGAMYIIFTPASETQMTYKYYPYTFKTEMGYIDPNRSRTPSLMMTKRHTFQEFMPAVACINILNNTGNPYNRIGEDPYRKWAS